VKIKISCQTSSETMAAVENGTVDMGIIGLPEKLKGFVSMPLMEIHDTFVTTDSYLKNLKIREGITKENVLKNAVFMMLNSENITRKYVERYLEASQIELTEIIEVGNMDLLIEFAKIDLGIACVIREFVQKELENKELREISLGRTIPRREVGFIYSPNTPRENTIVSAFMDYIVTQLS